MKRSLMGKVILSYLAVALITVLVASVLIRLNSGQSLKNLVAEQQIAALQDSAQTYYTANGSMTGFIDYYVQVNRPPSQPGTAKPPQARDMRGVTGLVDPEYRALIPTLGYQVGETLPAKLVKNATAVKVNGQVIAWIIPDTNYKFTLSPEEDLFLQRTTLAIGLAALAGVLVAVLMGYLLAGRLLKPIRRLTRASRALAQGDLQQQLPVTSEDELGLLTETFNQMSADLARADQQRKRLTADITHDLSTPLQIISGYIEMLEGGEVTLTPQRLDIMKTEVEHLRRLVSDLTTLSQVEAGGLEFQVQDVQPKALLERVFHAFQPMAAKQGVELVLEAPENLPTIQVDGGRMQQVLRNLVDNALRYTPAGGRITLQAAVAGPRLELRVADTGSGIEAADLPYVFDRFYKADPARGTSSGKMGLGLAICKALVNAQGGTIAAESAGRDQGASMVISLPVAG